MEIPPKYCYVADRSLYEAGRGNPEAMKLYEGSIIPVMDYRFGDYRFPEALVTSTVLGEQISVTGKMLDTPVLYTNSQELYLSNLTAQLREEHSDLDDTFLPVLNGSAARGKPTWYATAPPVPPCSYSGRTTGLMYSMHLEGTNEI